VNTYVRRVQKNVSAKNVTRRWITTVEKDIRVFFKRTQKIT